MSAKQALMVAAPASGSGKTVMTLALLRVLRKRGVPVAGAKAGPDYIDPAFHAVACGAQSVNLDPWAMGANRLQSLAGSRPGSHLLIEAMMGLFDGAADGSGSAASLAKILHCPVFLVVDAAKQSHSIAALVRGFRDHDPELKVAGVLLNRVGSSRHEAMLRLALKSIDMPVFGAVPRDTRLVLPERHLGLVQAGEVGELDGFIEHAADMMADYCDLEATENAFAAAEIKDTDQPGLPPLGQRIAIARDEAFSFFYPHLEEDWREQGAELRFFSPLQNEAPPVDCDAVFLPGGYPELHAARLAGMDLFHRGMRDAADRDALVYGECGGYMVLGEGLVDAEGKRHAMTGLLPLETSFEHRKLYLGYRRLKTDAAGLPSDLNAHEFHYTQAVREEGDVLFEVCDALGKDLGRAGLRKGRVMGSYMHLIDRGAQ